MLPFYKSTLVVKILKALGQTQTINSQTITVTRRNSAGLIVEAYGTAAASTQNSQAVYAKDARYFKTDAANGVTGEYRNTGTTASSSFTLLEGSESTVQQGAPTAKTTSSTLTAAEVLSGIITVNQAGGATSAQQLPTASDLDAALPSFAANDAFDFSVINTSTVDAEDASVTTNTGWTLVGNMDIHAYSAAGSLNSSARFRARKTGAAAWTLYRIS